MFEHDPDHGMHDWADIWLDVHPEGILANSHRISRYDPVNGEEMWATVMPMTATIDTMYGDREVYERESGSPAVMVKAQQRPNSDGILQVPVEAGRYLGRRKMDTIAGQIRRRRVGLRISGNINKLLYGHNIHGDDVNDLGKTVVRTFEQTALGRLAGKFAGFKGTASRIDVANSVQYRSEVEAAKALEAIAGSLSYRGSPVRVYSDGAERPSAVMHVTTGWTWKAYIKGWEMDAKRAKGELDFLGESRYNELRERAYGLLRLEVGCRRRFIRESGLPTGREPRRIYSRMVTDMGMVVQTSELQRRLGDVGTMYLLAGTLWMRGGEEGPWVVREAMPKATYYKFRKIMRGLGYNVDHAFDVQTCELRSLPTVAEFDDRNVVYVGE